MAPHATALANSQFGRFYANKLKLHLLQRRPDEWKQEVIGVRHHFAHQKDAVAAPAAAQVSVPASADANGPEGEVKKEKRKTREDKDEIDSLFAGAEKKKSKKRKA